MNLTVCFPCLSTAVLNPGVAWKNIGVAVRVKLGRSGKCLGPFWGREAQRVGNRCLSTRGTLVVLSKIWKLLVGHPSSKVLGRIVILLLRSRNTGKFYGRNAMRAEWGQACYFVGDCTHSRSCRARAARCRAVLHCQKNRTHRTKITGQVFAWSDRTW